MNPSPTQHTKRTAWRRVLALAASGALAIGGLGFLADTAWAAGPGKSPNANRGANTTTAASNCDGTGKQLRDGTGTGAQRGGMGGRGMGAGRGLGGPSVDRPSQAGTRTPAGPTITLNDEQKATLTFMVEEEKMAHDVYTTLGEKYSVRTFSNIANSEQRHMDSVRALLKTYGLADPTTDRAIGSFASQEVQQMYNDLTAEGSASLQAAYGVGKKIEVRDIDDLKKAIAAVPDSDVKTVYSNLLRGSENHLRAFESRLA